MTSKGIKLFMNKNLVAIVMIPSLVLVHWGWLKLQDSEVFVKKEEKKGLPIVEGAKILYDKIMKLDSESETPATTPTQN